MNRLRGIGLLTRIFPFQTRSCHETTAANPIPAFSHLDSEGRARMVDVTPKRVTTRTATARARVVMPAFILEEVKRQNMKKGDVLTVAQIAGISGAKKTSDLIPLCHNIPISKVDVSLHIGGGGAGETTDEAEDFDDKPSHSTSFINVVATVTAEAKTGVEMEALTAVCVASLTVYDMCKALSKDIVITDACLLAKDGGKVPYRRKAPAPLLDS